MQTTPDLDHADQSVFFQAVLLLRAEVSLYSTDALPINCSAYSAGPLRPAPTPASTPSQIRTCECLTQTLCCHGCGNAVGYMIVIPVRISEGILRMYY